MWGRASEVRRGLGLTGPGDRPPRRRRTIARTASPGTQPPRLVPIPGLRRRRRDRTVLAPSPPRRARSREVFLRSQGPLQWGCATKKMLLRRRTRGWLQQHPLGSATGRNVRPLRGALTGTTPVVRGRLDATRWSAAWAEVPPAAGAVCRAARHGPELHTARQSTHADVKESRCAVHPPNVTHAARRGIADSMVLFTPAGSRVCLVAACISMARACGFRRRKVPGASRRGWRFRSGGVRAAPWAHAPTPPAAPSWQSLTVTRPLSSARPSRDAERGEDEQPGLRRRAPGWRHRPPPFRRPVLSRTWSL